MTGKRLTASQAKALIWLPANGDVRNYDWGIGAAMKRLTADFPYAVWVQARDSGLGRYGGGETYRLTVGGQGMRVVIEARARSQWNAIGGSEAQWGTMPASDRDRRMREAALSIEWDDDYRPVTP